MIRTILQVRTKSQRLPAKAMLSVGGMPAIVLCAHRLAHGGPPVVVATSDHPSDEVVAQLMKAAGFDVYRGPLDDVRQRFLNVTTHMAPRDIIIRCTADNLFPNGQFLQAQVMAFEAQRLTYLGAGNRHSPDGLPYGMACEVFRVGDLRKSGGHPEDREHVCWSLRIAEPRRECKPGRDRSHLRATMDTLNDYLRIATAFADVADPVREPWTGLVNRLAALPAQSESEAA